MNHPSIKKAKALIFIFLSAFCFQTNAQETLTKAEWQEDLKFLQQTVNDKFPFLFKKVTAEKFNSEIEKFYSEIPSLEVHEIKVGLTRMVSLFEYGHTQIPFSTIAKEAILPVNLYHFEDGIYVEGALKTDKKIVGAKLLKVGKLPVEEALKAIRPVVPAENDQYFKGYGLRFLTVPAVLHTQGVIPKLSDKVTLTLEKNGKTFKHTLSAVPLSEMSKGYGFTIPNEEWESARDYKTTPLYLKQLNEKFYFFEYLADSKTLYVRQSSVFNDDKESLKDFYNRLFSFIDSNEINKFVYDVRLNGGGNNYNNKPLIKGLMARPELNKRGKFFYIIGRNTFSACQNLTNEIENYTEAIIVGEPTSENKNFYGDARRVTLPNSKINTYVSHAWWQDFPQWENKDWTIPHIAVEMTFNDYVANHDPVLNAALNYTETGFILNPMAHLTQLFAQGKFEEVKSEGAKIAKDPAYKYYDFEKEFGEAGNRLFESGDTQSGIFIMELVAESYPESKGALFSLANAYAKTKQIEKATGAYEKLLKLDVNGPLGTAARNKIKELRNK